MTNPLKHCHLIDLPQCVDSRGNLAFIEQMRDVPFEFKRLYYLYGMPEQSSRGGHAHKALHQLLIPVAGAFDIHLDDAHEKVTYRLDNPAKGLYICPYVWRELDNFSENAVCVVLASEYYDEADYYRDYDVFQQAVLGVNSA